MMISRVFLGASAIIVAQSLAPHAVDRQNVGK